ncbi:IS630 transposase-related protein [Candidatus Trichorickettsia mobilis]|uniref:IS630 transposase-related protein n=1 Tax=Candidatus Trichorickettsia mobilis TaxID=1346319 RepID=UPI0029310CB1|nr:IS630 transposase-related protein [Candidatus Trichorickettsia mobilis]
MTTSPYSTDLRKKVILYLNNNHSQLEASKLFNIHKNTINRWYIRYKKEGHVEPRVRRGFQSKVDKSNLERYVLANPEIKLSEIGVRYGITASQAGRILRQLGFSYKKKPLPMWKLMKRNEINA